MTETTRTFPLARLMQNRLALFLILLVIEAQFFVINMLNSQLRAPTDGWELIIPAIDNHLSPQGIWLIPYMVGFVLTAALPFWAAFVMPNKLFRQFVFSMAFAALVSYAIYIAVPTYVTKPSPQEVHGNDLFSVMLRNSYKLDAAASTHNAAPSQHVFYAIINMCYMIRFRPRPRVFIVWVTLGTLISASTLMTMRHNSPDLITGYLLALLAYSVGLWLGEWVTALLGDEHAPIQRPSLASLGIRRRAPRRLRRPRLRRVSVETPGME